ncbi:hypothetical protein L1887_10781 [Cichorium endivia]|nr:hypothetical protein L1887_10781 [Cichorium endivia]
MEDWRISRILPPGAYRSGGLIAAVLRMFQWTLELPDELYDAWSWNWRDQPRGIEHEQFSSIMVCLEGFNYDNEEDKWYWNLDDSG